jgi:hypothetical protein
VNRKTQCAATARSETVCIAAWAGSVFQLGELKEGAAIFIVGRVADRRRQDAPCSVRAAAETLEVNSSGEKAI